LTEESNTRGDITNFIKENCMAFDGFILSPNVVYFFHTMIDCRNRKGSPTEIVHITYLKSGKKRRKTAHESSAPRNGK
jgi:hypothetical protein